MPALPESDVLALQLIAIAMLLTMIEIVRPLSREWGCEVPPLHTIAGYSTLLWMLIGPQSISIAIGLGAFSTLCVCALAIARGSWLVARQRRRLNRTRLAGTRPNRRAALL